MFGLNKRMALSIVSLALLAAAYQELYRYAYYIIASLICTVARMNTHIQ